MGENPLKGPREDGGVRMTWVYYKGRIVKIVRKKEKET
jgi:hypothetical protein